jgi:hypothetical protein
MKITVPGYWARDVAVLDLETVKVPTGGFVMASSPAAAGSRRDLS